MLHYAAAQRSLPTPLAPHPALAPATPLRGSILGGLESAHKKLDSAAAAQVPGADWTRCSSDVRAFVRDKITGVSGGGARAGNTPGN